MLRASFEIFTCVPAVYKITILGFPLRRGRSQVKEIPEWSESHCQTVQFEPLTFYPDKTVHVQVSVSHVNQSDRVHDAAVAWVENVTVNGFAFCVMESGRNEGPPHGEATVEWMAYQGAPGAGLTGEVSIPNWWTGTKCQTVDVSAVCSFTFGRFDKDNVMSKAT